MTQIATNLGNTREESRQMRFEPVGTISAVNVQKAIEEVSSETPDTPPAPTVVTGAAAVIPSTAAFVYVNFAGTVALTLPDSTAWLAANQLGLPLTIQDISGNANDTTNKITITRAGADTINGATSVEIVSPFGGYKLRPPAGGSWAIQ